MDGGRGEAGGKGSDPSKVSLDQRLSPEACGGDDSRESDLTQVRHITHFVMLGARCDDNNNNNTTTTTTMIIIMSVFIECLSM